MKKLVTLSLIIGVFSTASVLGVTGTFKITNKGPKRMFYAIAVGDMIPTGSIADEFKFIDPGQTQTIQLTALELPTYVGIWESMPTDLRLIDVQGGVNFRPQAFKIYTFKLGKSIDAYWTGEKLRPTSKFGTLGAKASKKLLGTVKSIRMIPSR